MNNTVYEQDIKKKIEEINLLTTKVKTAFENMDQVIEENIHTGKGIWDGEASQNFKEEWKKLKEQIPSVLDAFEKQNKNLSNLLEITKKAEENEML